MRNRSWRMKKSFSKQKKRLKLAKELSIFTENQKEFISKNGWACNCYLCKPGKYKALEEIKIKTKTKEIEDYLRKGDGN